MPLLYYWRPDNYRRDRRFGFGYHLNQNSPAMLRAYPGESLWAFTRNANGIYPLAAELIIKAVTRNPPNYRYGIYRIWGDLNLSRYFDVDIGPNADLLIRQLEVAASSRLLGQSFQGHAAVRWISDQDHRLLSQFTRDLPVLDRVGFYPEDEFEALLVQGDAARSKIIAETHSGYRHRLDYLYDTVDVQRIRKNVEALQTLYAGQCQICSFDPRTAYAHSLCHGHHIQWLSRGGSDELDNMALVCPNHHAAIHRDDAFFDYATLMFRFSNGRVEKITLNQHLPMVS